ncbi:hypothetical protein [Dactylosporangium sp. NPDC049140]|jgi:hypothetical protein|uniref:hypothetical protein n=1 Tax=Dactylosporangium sp. NPDC049140 TaxID=3155647 RepID=UPI003410E6C5
MTTRSILVSPRQPKRLRREGHHIDLEVQQTGGGSRFTFTLPPASEHARARPAVTGIAQ